MNFFKKLFGKKTTPAPSPLPRPDATRPPAPAPVKTPEPFSPAPAPAPAPPPQDPLPPVTASSVSPSQSEDSNRPPSASFSSSEPPSELPAEPVKIETTLLTIDGPVWLPGDSPAIELFPAKPDDAAAIAFIGGSAELPQDGFRAVGGRAPFALDPGVLSRAIPMFLADQVELGTEALTRTLISWAVKPRAAFILGGKQWDDATAAHHARQSPADDPSDYLVLTHLVCTSSPWRIELRLVRTIDAACLTTLSAPLDPHAPGSALRKLASDLLACLSLHAEIPAQASGFATPPDSAEYVSRLHQLLMLRCAALPGATLELNNEESIIEGVETYARDNADNLPSRLLFTHSLSTLAKLRPALRPAVATRFEALESELPLTEPARAVLARIRQETLSG